MADIITKTPANTCVAIAQHAQGIVGDMMSAYWSVVEGKQFPAVFVSQAEDRLKTISNLLTAIKKTKISKD